ncbi:DNA repair protein RecN [Terrihabitans rhizophilus]|uniref:DNA repair protein RecN n=1 Tax=Terrihabitans rhizophilus TaxID=3092662 RepID=A0ABU4RPG4_9HYPH|nr:DNA repair protein RecN [Terrihabitans sp. PJ23]MDX6805585.1 DNA repair protein RecN [Terrihabitans sp. PJ23]
MLVQLQIRDIVLIERLDLAPARGLTVLTGETGAGKSILLDALTLALGGRGDAGLVRSGAAQGQVTAVFDLSDSHPARAALAAHDLSDEGDLILRRVQLADGRTRAFVNDQAVGVQALRAIASSLVEIHGQHDDRALVDPAQHRALLDAFGGLDGEVRGLARLHAAWRSTVQAREAQRKLVERVRAEADYLRHSHAELEELSPQEGEETELAAQRATMMQAEKIAGDLDDVHQAVTGPNSPVPALAAAIRRLERRAGQLPGYVEPAMKAIDDALVLLDEAGTYLEEAIRTAAFDPRDLERAEERLFALRAAARKFETSVEGLPAVAVRFASELAALEGGEEDLVRLQKEAAEAEEAYRTAAGVLSAKRREAAGHLASTVMAELPDLKLERARFYAEITEDTTPGPEGLDRVEFWVQTNPGTRAGPMLKVASGGELARFLLALKVALADRGSAPTLIFDEIDTGVGGAVADAIGARLARLGERVQVLAVTHAPQVAARALSHLLIAKDEVPGEERVATRVTPLEDMFRREEIARMLAGARITDEARAAADRLLSGAA